MTNSEKAVYDQQTSDAAPPASEISTYTEIFCKAMTQLNAVALEQAEGLLNIAVQAAEKFHSINPAAVNKDEFAEFINQMKVITDSISQINQEVPENPAARPPIPELFLATVEQALGNAVQNSASNQQALNQLGAAILARAAALLLSSNEKQTGNSGTRES